MKHYIAMTDRLEINDSEGLFLVEVVLYDTVTTEDESDVYEFTFSNKSKALKYAKVISKLQSTDLEQVDAIYKLLND